MVGEAFFATGSDPNNHKGAELVILNAQTAVDTISPYVDDWAVIQSRVYPATGLLSPIAIKPGHRIYRHSLALHQDPENIEGWGHLTAGHTYEVKPWQGRSKCPRCAILSADLCNAHKMMAIAPDSRVHASVHKSANGGR
jgi:hypothetical protein